MQLRPEQLDNPAGALEQLPPPHDPAPPRSWVLTGPSDKIAAATITVGSQPTLIIGTQPPGVGLRVTIRPRTDAVTVYINGDMGSSDGFPLDQNDTLTLETRAAVYAFARTTGTTTGTTGTVALLVETIDPEART